MKQGNLTQKHTFGLTLLGGGAFWAILGLGQKVPIFSDLVFHNLFQHLRT